MIFFFFFLRNIINSIEAEFTIELCEFLTKKTKLQQTNIGIISPYQQQKKIIIEGLTSKYETFCKDLVNLFYRQHAYIDLVKCVSRKSGLLKQVSS